MTSRVSLSLGESGWICVDAGEPRTIKDLAGLGRCWVSAHMGGGMAGLWWKLGHGDRVWLGRGESM